MVNYEYPPLGGGGGVAMEAVAQDLSRRHIVDVLSTRAKGVPEVERWESGDLTVYRSRAFMRSSRSVASMSSMAAFLYSGSRLGLRLAREHRYDVINTWFALPTGPAGAWIARHAGIPHLLTIIGGDIYDPSKWYSPHQSRVTGWAVRSVMSRADRHTAISRDIARRAGEQFGFERPIEVISLGIQPPSFTARSRSELGLRDDRVYLATIGRHVRRKDFPTLIRALRLLDRPDVDLLMIGDGPERANLEGLAREVGMSDRVHFLGFVEDERKFQLLAVSDLFILTSLHEGFGLVYLEAMHCGLPVVASTSGGQEDFLRDGETGVLVPSGDADSLCKALQRLLRDAPWRARISEQNRKIVRSYYVSRTAQAYERLLRATARAMFGIGTQLPDNAAALALVDNLRAVLSALAYA
jgi:glycosyltransferase involved in cell wall biosynthesis